MLQHQVTTALLALNIILLLVIIWFNGTSYMKVKAQYTVFLLIFSAIFLIENVTSLVFFVKNLELYIPKMATHVLVITGLQTVAFGCLLWMQSR